MEAYQNNFRKEVVIEIRPSVINNFTVFIVFPPVVGLMALVRGGDFSWSTFFFTITISLLFYFIAQFDYHGLKIFKDRVLVEYPLSFYRKPKAISLSEIEFVYFKDAPHVGYRGTPFLTFVLQSQKKVNVILDKELGSARYELRELGIRIVNAKSVHDRVENYMRD